VIARNAQDNRRHFSPSFIFLAYHPTLCSFPSLPLDTSPRVCFDCKARFHGLCQNVHHHPKADVLKLLFCFEYLCPGCANAKPSSNVSSALLDVSEAIANVTMDTESGCKKSQLLVRSASKLM